MDKFKPITPAWQAWIQKLAAEFETRCAFCCKRVAPELAKRHACYRVELHASFRRVPVDNSEEVSE